MILYHAPGGGLGHLSRGLSVMKTLGLPPETFLITYSGNDTVPIPQYTAPRLVPIKGDDPIEFAGILDDLIGSLSINKLFVDTFPAGIVGELLLLKRRVPMVLISRILKIKNYLLDLEEILKQNPFPEFEMVFRVETLNPEFINFLDNQKWRPEWISLIPHHSTKPDIFSEPFYLVSHTGSAEEKEALLQLAIEHKRETNFSGKILLTSSDQNLKTGSHPTGEISQVLGEKINIEYIFQYNISQYYDSAEKIFTGCGFNTLRELSQYRNKHISIPFERKYDDQFFRKISLEKKK